MVDDDLLKQKIREVIREEITAEGKKYDAGTDVQRLLQLFERALEIYEFHLQERTEREAVLQKELTITQEGYRAEIEVTHQFANLAEALRQDAKVAKEKANKLMDDYVRLSEKFVNVQGKGGNADVKIAL